MIIPDQYPHTLSYVTLGTPDEYDEETGTWIPGTPGETITISCRAIPNGSGKTLKGEDGQAVDYDFDIAFPEETERIPTDLEVSIIDQHDVELISGRLLRWHPGQLHNRGWI